MAVDTGKLVAVLVALTVAFGGPGAQVPRTPPPFVPCPMAELDPPPARPEPPAPPRHAPGDRLIGGPGMATAGLVVPQDAPDPPGDLSATAWLVADLDTGDVYGACGPHEYRLPASTQKLLLALALLDGLDPQREVEIVPADLRFEPGSSAVGLLSGGTYPVETLWLGLLLNSGNDAANALARVGGGDRGVTGALAAMNRTAEVLGARQTHAVTPSGLDGPGQFTSAYDLALIARALFAREDFRGYVATERAAVPAQPPRDPEGFEIQNQDPLLGVYDGFLGGKTGFTDLARHAYVGAAERDGRRLLVTVLGAEARPVRAARQAAALLDWGFSLRRPEPVGRLVEPGEVLVGSVLPEGLPTPAPTPSGTGPAEPSQATALPAAVVWAGWIVGGTAAVVFVCGVLLMLARPLIRGR